MVKFHDLLEIACHAEGPPLITCLGWLGCCSKERTCIGIDFGCNMVAVMTHVCAARLAFDQPCVHLGHDPHTLLSEAVFNC